MKINIDELEPETRPEFLGNLNPWPMARNLWGHRDLIRQFTVREVLGRYRGSFLGFFWTFISPLLMLSVYALVFGTLIKPKIEPPMQFTMELFCGMIVFNVFSETLMRAPQLITGNINYVKKVVFPLEVLPVAVLGSVLIHAAISSLILLLGVGVALHHISWTMLYVMAGIVPLVMLCCGLAWIVAGLGVFVRDLAQLVIFVVQFMMFMTPIFYAPELIPQEYRWVFHFNPLAVIILDARRAMIWDQHPWWPGWLGVTAVSFAVMMLGYAWFMHSKKFFADSI